MLTLPLLRKMLNRAGTELKANSKYLCELDSVAGDGDHGITIGRMADVMKEKTEDTTIDTMRVLLDELGDAFMGINGGSAGPLWGTVFTGMAEGIDDQAELTWSCGKCLRRPKKILWIFPKQSPVIRLWSMRCIRLSMPLLKHRET